MGYSKDVERENKALQSILDGGAPEQRILIGYEGKKLKKGDNVSKLTNVMKEARMPWFCPKCDKIMKKRLDNKMWLVHDHCFDCQLKLENKMRIDGTYDKWKDQKIIANKLAWIKDQKVLIEEFKTQKTPEFLQQINPDGHSVDKEKWDIDKDSIVKQADEALEFLQKMEDSLK
jgi:ribosomal protein L37AE/L43A|tara:strand:- start:350 stop:871 length:522 start_codon:yes stop_codon:yes gene_type:complete